MKKKPELSSGDLWVIMATVIAFGRSPPERFGRRRRRRQDRRLVVRIKPERLDPHHVSEAMRQRMAAQAQSDGETRH